MAQARHAVAALGGVAGAVLLLSTPAEGSSGSILLGFAAIFAICIYGGYFGAAAGVLLLALLLRVGGTTLARANAYR